MALLFLCLATLSAIAAIVTFRLLILMVTGRPRQTPQIVCATLALRRTATGLMWRPGVTAAPEEIDFAYGPRITRRP